MIQINFHSKRLSDDLQGTSFSIFIMYTYIKRKISSDNGSLSLAVVDIIHVLLQSAHVGVYLWCVLHIWAQSTTMWTNYGISIN